MVVTKVKSTSFIDMNANRMEAKMKKPFIFEWHSFKRTALFSVLCFHYKKVLVTSDFSGFSSRNFSLLARSSSVMSYTLEKAPI